MLRKVAFTMFLVTDATRARAFHEGVLGLTRGLAAPDGVWTEYDLPMLSFRPAIAVASRTTA